MEATAIRLSRWTVSSYVLFAFAVRQYLPEPVVVSHRGLHSRGKQQCHQSNLHTFHPVLYTPIYSQFGSSSSGILSRTLSTIYSYRPCATLVERCLNLLSKPLPLTRQLRQLTAQWIYGNYIYKTNLLNIYIQFWHEFSCVRQPLQRQLPELLVMFLTNKRCAFVVRVHWEQHLEGSLLELCSGGPECHHHRRSSFGGRRSKVRPRGEQFDFEDLDYSQRYSVKLIRNSSGMHRAREIVKSFTTPSLQKFNETLPDLMGYNECERSKQRLKQGKTKVLL